MCRLLPHDLTSVLCQALSTIRNYNFLCVLSLFHHFFVVFKDWRKLWLLGKEKVNYLIVLQQWGTRRRY